MMNILIADKFDDAASARIRENGHTVVVEADLKDDALTDAIRTTACDVLVVRSTRVSMAHLKASPSLRLIIRAGSGYDTIDVDTASAHGIRVCNCPGMNSVAVAELTIGLMIALDRQLVDETDDLRHGVWNKKRYGSQALGLKGRTLGVFGLGRIGYEVAKRAAAFEMKLCYSDVICRPEIETELNIRRLPSDQLLMESDFVTLHVPGGSETKRIIGARELAMMKSTGFILNCSRGGIIDEEALAEATRNGTIAGAALDVFEIEPAAGDTRFTDPVCNAPHLYGTHHVGASTQQAQLAVAEETVRIIDDFATLGEFRNCVNPAHQAPAT